MKCTNDTTTCEPTQMATKPAHRKGWVFCPGSVTLGSHQKRGSSNTPASEKMSRLLWNMAPPCINEQRMAEKSSSLKTFYQRRMWCCNSCVLEGLCVHGSRFKITRVTGFIAGQKSSIWLMFHSSSIGFHLLHFVYHDSFPPNWLPRASTMVGTVRVAWWGSILGTPTTWIRTIRIQQSSRNAWSGSRIKDLRTKPNRNRNGFFIGWVPGESKGDPIRFGTVKRKPKKCVVLYAELFFSKTCENGFWVAVQMENDGKWLWMRCPSKKANCKKL